MEALLSQIPFICVHLCSSVVALYELRRNPNPIGG